MTSVQQPFFEDTFEQQPQKQDSITDCDEYNNVAKKTSIPLVSIFFGLVLCNQILDVIIYSFGFDNYSSSTDVDADALCKDEFGNPYVDAKTQYPDFYVVCGHSQTGAIIYYIFIAVSIIAGVIGPISFAFFALKRKLTLMLSTTLLCCITCFIASLVCLISGFALVRNPNCANESCTMGRRNPQKAAYYIIIVSLSITVIFLLPIIGAEYVSLRKKHQTN